MALYMGIVLIGMMTTIGLVAVDAGLIYSAKSELQTAVDSAARYAAMGLRDGGLQKARENVNQALADNPVRGQIAFAGDDDLTYGLWDPQEVSLITLAGKDRNGATAIRVTARLNPDAGNGIQSFFGSLLGYDSYAMVATATAAIGEPVNLEIDARACPYLAGMGAGDGVKFTAKTHLSWAPEYSTYEDCKPVLVPLDVYPGQVLYFRDVEGETGDYNSGLTYGLEGNLSRPDMAQDPVNGFDTTLAPLNALMGVFLDDNRPTQTPVVDGLDFSTPDSREKTQYEPLVKQQFFIGDGVAEDTKQLQKFV
ncbi:MAG: pilus assembly protein TadG-related protein, partial [Planctomycetota bacterium]